MSTPARSKQGTTHTFACSLVYHVVELEIPERRGERCPFKKCTLLSYTRPSKHVLMHFLLLQSGTGLDLDETIVKIKKNLLAKFNE
jgi:hypothetical protein